MAGYQRKIAYLDYLENGMKIRNAGFVRIEGNGTQMRLELRVKNIPETFHGQYELKTDTDDVIGRISLSRGSGSCCVVWQTGVKMPEGKRLVQAEGVYIRLPGRHLLQAVWDSPLTVCVEANERTEEKRVAAPEETAKREPAEERETADLQEREDVRTAESVQPKQQKPMELQELIVPQKNIVPFAERQPDQEEGAQETRDGEEQVCYGDKWEQLTHMYPVIHPFGDGREYLSIAPKDFVVLRQEHQKMVHNSFLLHGYYNYKHLILGKIKKGAEWRYYLGVPGNFYGREKMVAEMFGFEAFEGEKEPVRAGDFGYFMKQVEI